MVALNDKQTNLENSQLQVMEEIQDATFEMSNIKARL